MKKTFFTALLLCLGGVVFSQSSEELQLKAIYQSVLTKGQGYQWLDYLSNQIGHRLSGSDNAEKAVQYTKAQLETLGLDRVFLQEVMVPKWVRGAKETAYIKDGKNKIEVPICALGGSIATPKKGLLAPVIEVHSIKELES